MWVPAGDPRETLDSSVARRTFVGFFILGLLMSFPGAILPAWGYHIQPSFSAVGLCFLALSAGLVVAARVALGMLPVRGSGPMLASGCLIAFAAMLYLSEVPPPLPDVYRVGGFLILGSATGFINSGVFDALQPLYRHSPAAAVNLAGTFFGLGSLVTALLIAGTYYVYDVPSMLFLFSIIPLFAGIAFARAPWPSSGLRRRTDTGWLGPETRTASGLLLGTMLFLQFANEWSIAGWLAVFLIRRLGMSPPTAVGLLALYWAALVIGRLVSQLLLQKVRHTRLLMAAVTGAMIGCLLLTFTTNGFGASLGVLTVGGAFSVTYPLFVERIGARFPNYQPGLYNGVFTLALTGGMLAPALLALVANEAGIQAVMLLPMAGSVLVFVLLAAAILVEKLRKTVLLEP